MHGRVEAADATAEGVNQGQGDRSGASDRHEPADSARRDPAAWSAMAACRGADPKLFFPAPRCPPSDEARAYCAQCPVSDECLEYAVSLRLAGIWGGTSETQRIKLRRLRREQASMGGDLRWQQRSSAAV